MNAEILNQFILAIGETFTAVANLQLKKDSSNIFSKGFKMDASVATIIRIDGDIKGQVVMVIDRELGMKLASAILRGIPVKQFDLMAESAVAEMGNMITAKANKYLQRMGYNCTAAVPTVVKNKPIELGFAQKCVVIVINYVCSLGPVKVIIGIDKISQPAPAKPY